MPDPDPRPSPQARAISTTRWLLLLSPSAIAVAVPVIDLLVRPGIFAPNGGDVTLELLSLAFAFLLCFVLGFFLEKWRSGSFNRSLMAIGWGLLILLINFLVALGGCSAALRILDR
jgi:hypothetical protein